MTTQANPAPAGFTVVDGVAKGRLTHGMSIAGRPQTDFELREYDVGDLLDAEGDAPVTSMLAFNAQLLLRQLQRVGDFTGPFTLNMIRQLKPADWRILRAAQQALETSGEPDSAGGAAR